MDKTNRTPESFIERLHELMQIQNGRRFGQPGCDRCVDFLTAMRRILDFSFGVHQWIAQPVTDLRFRNKKWSRRYLIVCYSNPDSTGLPNHLSFCLPLLMGRIGPVGPRTLLACFASESIVPLSKGLYWEDNDLRYDALEDYSLFWKPLERCLWPLEAERHSERSTNSMDPGQENSMLGGISYKDSIGALARVWSESKEKLQNEIQS
jgi:hypothetical protein